MPSLIAFTPVPRLRKRRNGWSEERQRAFILALSQCGSVSRAARSVGLTRRSAYRLLDAEGADSFAAAWDQAIEEGVERVRVESLDRSLRGAPVAVFRRGKLQRIEHRTNDRLAIALLSGRAQPIGDLNYSAVLRRAHRQDLRVCDAARAADDGSGKIKRETARFLVDRLEREIAGKKIERTGRERPWEAKPLPSDPPCAEGDPSGPRRAGPRITRL